jgi:hypothetical protein
MPDIQALIKQAKEQLKRVTEDLAIWESFDTVTITDDKGKSFDVRAEMITRCKLNMQKYRQIVEGLEARAKQPN